MNKKVISIIFFIVATAFYAVAIIGFITELSSAVIFMCFGSAFICLGSAMLVQSNKENKPKEGIKPDESSLSEEEKIETEKQNDDFTTIDTMM